LALFSSRLLLELYRDRDFRDAWTPARARDMLELAQGSVAHGLEPSDFNAEAIADLLSQSVLDNGDQPQERWRAELILSDALLRYLNHLQYGKYNPRRINPSWTFVDSVDAAELQSEMETLFAASDLKGAVAAVLPQAPFYEQLKLGYGRYLALNERLRAEDGWAPIAAGGNLTQGMRDARVPRIRDQLVLLDGYRFPPSSDPERYDQALLEAVKEFQGRSGLARDGVIGPRTLAALNQPLDERLALIRANLERMRWLYHELPSDYVLVDITAYQLEVMRDHEPVWSTRTVVGTEQNQTPMFRDEMEHLVFNPTWSVPPSIQKKMRGAPSDYKVIDRRSGRRVYPSNPTDHRRYRLVQQPGPRNALGQVKFMFPNGHAIYLHDTPSRHLFSRSSRSYSHGCVRVHEPLTLAEQLLAKQNWDMAAIKRVVSSGRTRYVNLEEHLPVLLYYLTARADDQGRVGFRPDVYNRDARLLAALGGPSDAARIVFREPPEPAADQIEAPETGPAEALTATEETAARVDASAESEPAVAAAVAGSTAPVEAISATTEDRSASQPTRFLAQMPARSVRSDQSAMEEDALEQSWWGLKMDLQALSDATLVFAPPADGDRLSANQPADAGLSEFGLPRLGGSLKPHSGDQRSSEALEHRPILMQSPIEARGL
jgi:murein L,D-transpeptidase YcbB/YkuD